MPDAAHRMTPAVPAADAADAFQALLERHRGIVFKVAGTYRWDPEDRADLGQDIVAELWRAFPRYDPARPFPTWMYRIALNVAISSLRRDRHRSRTTSLDEDHHRLVDTDTPSPEQARHVQQLHRYIDRQPPLDRALLLLYLEDHGYREIAEILGISETNVATKLSRLKQRLRDEL